MEEEVVRFDTEIDQLFSNLGNDVTSMLLDDPESKIND